MPSTPASSGAPPGSQSPPRRRFYAAEFKKTTHTFSSIPTDETPPSTSTTDSPSTTSDMKKASVEDEAEADEDSKDGSKATHCTAPEERQQKQEGGGSFSLNGCQYYDYRDTAKSYSPQDIQRLIDSLVDDPAWWSYFSNPPPQLSPTSSRSRLDCAPPEYVYDTEVTPKVEQPILATIESLIEKGLSEKVATIVVSDDVSTRTSPTDELSSSSEDAESQTIYAENEEFWCRRENEHGGSVQNKNNYYCENEVEKTQFRVFRGGQAATKSRSDQELNSRELPNHEIYSQTLPKSTVRARANIYEATSPCEFEPRKIFKRPTPIYYNKIYDKHDISTSSVDDEAHSDEISSSSCCYQAVNLDTQVTHSQTLPQQPQNPQQPKQLSTKSDSAVSECSYLSSHSSLSTSSSSSDLSYSSTSSYSPSPVTNIPVIVLKTNQRVIQIIKKEDTCVPQPKSLVINLVDDDLIDPAASMAATAANMARLKRFYNFKSFVSHTNRLKKQRVNSTHSSSSNLSDTVSVQKPRRPNMATQRLEKRRVVKRGIRKRRHKDMSTPIEHYVRYICVVGTLERRLGGRECSLGAYMKSCGELRLAYDKRPSLVRFVLVRRFQLLNYLVKNMILAMIRPLLGIERPALYAPAPLRLNPEQLFGIKRRFRFLVENTFVNVDTCKFVWQKTASRFKKLVKASSSIRRNSIVISSKLSKDL